MRSSSICCALVWQETKSPLYAARIAETCDWVLREMVAEGGGFAATYDADSEGVEGKFYVWDAAEIDAVLGADDGAFFQHGLRRHGRGQLGASQHPPPQSRARRLLSDGRGAAARRLARQAEGRARQARVAGLGRQGAGRLERADDRRAGQCRGRLPARRLAGRRRARLALRHGQDARRGRPAVPFPARPASGCIAARSTTTPTWRAPASRCSRRPASRAYLDEAKALVAVLDRHFADAAAGGYFITADDAADLIVRSKHCHDNAAPAGNGTLVGVFARLWVLTGDARLARQGRAPGRGLRRRAGQQLLPADDPAQRLRDAAERRRAGDRRRSLAPPQTEALRRAVYAQKPARQDRPPPGPGRRAAGASSCRRQRARRWKAGCRMMGRKRGGRGQAADDLVGQAAGIDGAARASVAAAEGSPTITSSTALCSVWSPLSRVMSEELSLAAKAAT